MFKFFFYASNSVGNKLTKLLSNTNVPILFTYKFKLP